MNFFDSAASVSFVSRVKRGIKEQAEREEDEKDKITKRKRESTKLAKIAAKEKIIEDTVKIVPFEEPDAPDTNDYEADQEEEYSLWVEREIERIRKEQRIIAEEAWREAKGREKEAMSTKELIEMNARNKKPKEKMKFMQKSFHRGAFMVDDSERSKELAQRNFMTPTGDDLLDKTALPKEFLVRGDDLHKKGRSKYTHLANEDTTTMEYRELQAVLNGEKPKRRQINGKN